LQKTAGGNGELGISNWELGLENSELATIFNQTATARFQPGLVLHGCYDGLPPDIGILFGGFGSLRLINGQFQNGSGWLRD
jgi:hypothetical protein